MQDLFSIHHSVEAHPDISTPDPHQDTYSKSVLGFWIYLMTDCLLFTSLFLAYAVLHFNTFGGPGPAELFDLRIAFAETMFLLFSSVTCGLSVLSAVKGDNKKVMQWLIATFVLGGLFIAMELTEFRHLVLEGNSWERSAFLSSFFTLVGTHGLHVSVGLVWLLVMCGQIYAQSINVDTFRRLVIFSMFWHFLDLIWIFIFTFVYLLGVI
ncbi:MAG: cytochrome o ubiquinol oxidase subunit III [Chlamydiia bacterium]|nr:cytochrome o ubiquinol oxidase subunit III [Chlamydiia bacterium]